MLEVPGRETFDAPFEAAPVPEGVAQKGATASDLKRLGSCRQRAQQW
jgi:hypothetical protein